MPPRKSNARSSNTEQPNEVTARKRRPAVKKILNTRREAVEHQQEHKDLKCGIARIGILHLTNHDDVWTSRHSENFASDRAGGGGSLPCRTLLYRRLCSFAAFAFQMHIYCSPSLVIRQSRRRHRSSLVVFLSRRGSGKRFAKSCHIQPTQL